ncbi:hypothetical protein [Microbacterium oleivorans]|uniref:Uncharacterized protein n=1 Tax=Microbacterium oleivorans TaxID=273677 RepID=A0A7D5IRS2_9MICO|nr:hypothetical protein [Microbacterium oleivorans]QLD10897.1 hypothetical protein HW566_03315 [Microbacterium oleivorans]
MGIQIDPDEDVVTPKSTGAVPFDGAPTVTEAVADNASTDAVTYVPPGTTEVTYPADAVVAQTNVDGPVTTSVSWLKDVQTKPVEAPETPEPEQKPKRAQTKRVTAKTADAGDTGSAK